MPEPTAEIIQEPKQQKSHEMLIREQLRQLSQSLLGNLTALTEESEIEISSGEHAGKPWIYGVLSEGAKENPEIYQRSTNFKLHIPIYFPEDGVEGVKLARQIAELLLTPNSDGQLTEFKVALPHLQEEKLTGTQKYKGMVIYPRDIKNGKSTNLSEAMRLADSISVIVQQHPQIAKRFMQNGFYVKPGVSMRYGDIDEFSGYTDLLSKNHRDLSFWEIFDDIFREEYSELFLRIVQELKEYGIEEL